LAVQRPDRDEFDQLVTRDATALAEAIAKVQK
jgi:hypothetical protein